MISTKNLTRKTIKTIATIAKMLSSLKDLQIGENYFFLNLQISYKRKLDTFNAKRRICKLQRIFFYLKEKVRSLDTLDYFLFAHDILNIFYSRHSNDT